MIIKFVTMFHTYVAAKTLTVSLESKGVVEMTIGYRGCGLHRF